MSDRRARPDIGEVHGVGEDRLHRARTGVVDVPLDPHRPAEPLRSEPGLPLPLEVPGDEGLDVRDVREVPDPQQKFLRLRRPARERTCHRGHEREKEAYGTQQQRMTRRRNRAPGTEPNESLLQPDSADTC